MKYKNLLAEMVRADVSREDIAKTIGKSYNHTREKLNGKYPFLYGEAVAIQEKHFPDLDIKYLFEEFE